MPDRPRVLATMPLPEAALVPVRALADVDVWRFTTRDELIEKLRDADLAFTNTIVPLDADVLSSAPRLRAISNFGVGFDHIDVPHATDLGIVVTNTPDVLTDAVADLTLGLIIALARRIVEGADFVRAGRWRRGEPPAPLGCDLRGKTLGIVGFGRIGVAVARRAQVFGMAVRYCDVRGEIEGAAGLATHCSLDDVLRESDFVTLHVNLMPETTKLIGARELALMKPSAFLVNTARGPVIDQPALVEALREGRIAGAALDVTQPEPPAVDDPLLSLLNVIVVPHIGSATRETRGAMLDLALRNLVALIAGEIPPCALNPEAWQAREGSA
jgi:glyoxylate reductase